jgi:hypothetical protein
MFANLEGHAAEDRGDKPKLDIDPTCETNTRTDIEEK